LPPARGATEVPELEATAAGGDVSVHLRMAIIRLSRRLEETSAGAALTSAETTVLATSALRGPVGLSALARAEGMSPSMLAGVVRQLERFGLIVGGATRTIAAPRWRPTRLASGCTSRSAPNAVTS